MDSETKATVMENDLAVSIMWKREKNPQQVVPESKQVGRLSQKLSDGEKLKRAGTFSNSIRLIILGGKYQMYRILFNWKESYEKRWKS